MKRTITRLLFLVPGLLSIGSALAADLMEVYREAVVKDAQYAAAKAAHAAAQEKLPQGRAGLLPAVNLSA
ncbi:MAG: channel protein TolC, partial [Betaproteobacteria bacterium]|nr:channel protein TolC [Betaproteobacteria bacterium]